MAETFLDKQVRDAFQKLVALKTKAPGPADHLLAEALEELSVALEELQVSQDELKQQNEELITTRGALEIEKQRYQELFDFAPEAYLVTDSNGVILETNRWAEVLLSVPKGFLLRKSLATYVAEKDKKSFRTRLAQLTESGRQENWEIALRPRKGAPFLASLTVRTVSDPVRSKIGLLWLILDITDRKQREQYFAQLASFPEMNPNPVLEIDLAGNIQYLNPAVQRLFPDLQASGLKHPWLSGLNSILNQIQKGRISSPVLELKVGDLWYQQNFYYDFEAGRLCIYGLDITLRKAMEKEIRRSHEKLEIRIEERTAELKKANEAIAEQSKILESVFLHSLNPLVLLDRNFNFIRVNKAFADAWQLWVEDFPGQNLFKFFPHDKSEAIFRRVLETKIPFKIFADPFPHPDHPNLGKTYWDWSLTPLLDGAGEVEILVLSINDVTEEQRTIESLRQNEALLQTVLKALPIGIWIADQRGRIIQGNPAGQQIWGDAGKIGMPLNGNCKGWWLETGNRVEPGQWAGARAFTGGETSLEEEVEIECSDGTRKIILNSAVPIQNENREITGAVVVNQDVTERMELRKWTRANNALLDLFPRRTERKDYLEAVVELIQWWSGCQNVGIRVLDEEGNIPYESHIGFQEDFCESESWLSLNRDQCVCVRVLQGNPDPQDTPMMTPNGSFRCNNTAQYVAGLSEEEQARFRGVCIKTGYLSVAVIPIRYQNKILGGIHLADEKEGRVSQKTVEFIEGMTPLIGEVLNRFNLESELKRNLDAQSRINALLRFSSEEVSLDEFLKGAIEQVVSFPWLGTGISGCIFLVEESSDVLVLKAQKGFPDSFAKQCARVPFNRCLCGKAILSPQLDFIDCPEGNHEMDPGDKSSRHAHYLIPIHFAGKVLGLINIYLAGDHPVRNQEKEGFFKAIADILANTIVRKQGEGALRESETRLRLLSSKLLTSQEMERRKIALEVHDSLGSSLSAIKFMVEEVIQRIPNGPITNTVESLEALVPIIQETIGEARRIQTDLRPPLLDELGISATLSWFCRRFQTVYKNILVEQAITVPEEEMPDSLKTVLFRITQEAMNNISKHSGADLVRLGLKKADGRIELIIGDNGKGFDLNELPAGDLSKKGVGLPSMKERTEYSGGFFTIDSAKGKGTIIKASWPV